MISFNQFLTLKEALSLTDPLVQSTLKIIDKSSQNIMFEFNLDNNKYNIDISNTKRSITLDNKELDELNLMKIYLQVNNSYALTNKMGMQANTVYNMLLNAIKQAHDHFGENNIDGYAFSGAQSNQNVMYDRLMKRFAPNLVTWEYNRFIKPEAVQKLKDQNPQMIDEINEKINIENVKKQINIQNTKQFKALQRKISLNRFKNS
jgi:hypothetical protein